MKRRAFLQSVAVSAAAVSLTEPSSQAAPSANDKITICVTGVRGRGGSLLETFTAIPEVTVKYVCDLDAQVLASRVAQV
ncbi:MAG: gfo/Idh/MocA family oxidoreductase, partial [Planctomycetales bacterium]|nr:gfo/Idh/MocA family oxidoreductase [Planctomycetales bacterium]